MLRCVTVAPASPLTLTRIKDSLEAGRAMRRRLRLPVDADDGTSADESAEVLALCCASDVGLLSIDMKLFNDHTTGLGCCVVVLYQGISVPAKTVSTYFPLDLTNFGSY